MPRYLGLTMIVIGLHVQPLVMLGQSLAAEATQEPGTVEGGEARPATAAEPSESDRAAALRAKVSDLYRAGRYDEAIAPAEEELRIRRSIVGEKHPEYAANLSNLGVLYKLTGDFPRAEAAYREAMAIRQDALGEEHPLYAASLNNLAGLYLQMGDYPRAKAHCEQALAIRKESLGEKHPDYAASLSGLGLVYVAMEDFARARPLLEQALAIDKELVGDNHPSYALGLIQLAQVPVSTEDYAEAERLCQKALAIWKETLGERHPHYLAALQLLARVYGKTKDYARAEPLFQQALAMSKEVFGERHPRYAISLGDLGDLYRVMRDFARAEPLHEEAVAVTSTHLDATAMVMTEQQQLAHARSVRHQLDHYLRCLFALEGREAIAHAAVLRFKGATLIRQQALRRSADQPELAELVAKLQVVTRQWATLGASPPKPEDREIVRQKLEELWMERERLEKELASKSAPFRKTTREVSPRALAAAMADDAVLIDYFGITESKTSGGLLAYVLDPEGKTQCFNLGPMDLISADIQSWRTGLGIQPDAIEAGRRLRERLWEPLAAAVGDAKTVLISPDGVLGTFPFAALPGKEPGTFLIEDHRLVLVPVPRLIQSAREDNHPEELDNELLVIGGVDYDRADVLGEPPLLLAQRSPSPLGTPGRNTRSAVDGQRWDWLPGAAAEAETVKQHYLSKFGDAAQSIRDVRGGEATEAAFRQYAPNCRHVHVATHGFFATPDKTSALAPEDIADAEDRLGFDESTPFYGYSPGLLSGLVFAGANRPLAVPSDPLDYDRLPDDGILTADEIASLTLDGVNLVVLSACETGLGEVAGGEGLLGLQRAFQVAGAKATIASLWKVPDEATSELMAHFYTNLWQKELPPIDALRQAQLRVLNGDPLPSDGRDRGPSGQRRQRIDTQSVTTRRPPREWAAWVLSGDAGF